MDSPGTRRLAAGSAEVGKGLLAQGLGGTSPVPRLGGCVSLTRLYNGRDHAAMSPVGGV